MRANQGSEYEIPRESIKVDDFEERADM